MEELKWFVFNQNNSGGSFKVNDKLCHRLYIQATNFDNALNKGTSLGVYFNGVEDGIDCQCCGDRWTYPNEVNLKKGYYLSEYISFFHPTEEATKIALEDKIKKIESIGNVKAGKIKKDKEYTPKLISKLSFGDIESFAQYMANEYGFTKPDCKIYYNDGTVKDIFSNKGYLQ